MPSASLLINHERNRGAPTSRDRRPTLVLDMDETLLHAKHGRDLARSAPCANGHDNDAAAEDFIRARRCFVDVYLRPGLRAFLRRISKLYRVVVFTAATQEYADAILDTIDMDCLLTNRVYRQHCIRLNGNYIKDLSRVSTGAQLQRTIIIDNLRENFQLQPHQGIWCRDFVGSESDNAFLPGSGLLELLEEFATSGCPSGAVLLRRHVHRPGCSFLHSP